MKSEAEHVVINALTAGRSDRGCFGDHIRLFLKIGYNHQNTEIGFK